MSGRILSPEFLLAAACCRWPASPARDAAVRATAASVQDWEAFLRAVAHPRVVGFVHDASPAAGTMVPAAVTAKLAARLQRNQLLLDELSLLQRWRAMSTSRARNFVSSAQSG
jgi:hypothetical protein